MDKVTIRSDRKTDYKFQYKGEDVVLGAGKIISIADGLTHVVLPTCAMKIKTSIVDFVPVGIDTKEDLEKFKKIVKGGN